MASIEKIAESVETIKTEFEKHQYICSDQIATAVYLAYHLRKPILIEGPPGVGKTELAKTASEMFDLSLIRLQCYEGLDISQSSYEWNYGKQVIVNRSGGFETRVFFDTYTKKRIGHDHTQKEEVLH